MGASCCPRWECAHVVRRASELTCCCRCLPANLPTACRSRPTARKRLAVPYRAAHVPSERSEYAQPDTALTLTQLALYHRGLLREQLLEALRELLRLGLNAQQAHYREWLALARDELPPGERAKFGGGGVGVACLFWLSCAICRLQPVVTWTAQLPDVSTGLPEKHVTCLALGGSIAKPDTCFPACPSCTSLMACGLPLPYSLQRSTPPAWSRWIPPPSWTPPTANRWRRCSPCSLTTWPPSTSTSSEGCHWGGGWMGEGAAVRQLELLNTWLGAS